MKPIILTIILLLSSSLAFSQCADPAQRAAFAQLPKSEQSRLWIERFDEFDRISKMNDAQRATWAKFREIISPEAFSLMNDPNFLETPFGKKFAKHWDQAKRVFPPEQLNSLFMTLPNFKGRLENVAPSCGCSSTWTVCGFDSECAGTGCIQVVDCGPFWAFVCDMNGCGPRVPNNDYAPRR